MEVTKSSDVEIAETQPSKAQQPPRTVQAMNKGDDDSDSYSKNSVLQDCLSQIYRLALTDALERVALPSEGGGPVVVADMGSSSGPNTIDNITFIVDKLRARMPHDAEFQAYFNDLPSNDFNNLFCLLTKDGRTPNFFAAGVPGTYFDRLFGQSSVHVFFSSHCLHWISKIPDEVLDKKSPAYNSGSLWLYHSRSAVARAYQQQALADMKTFLRARAAELVSGGLLFIICLANPAFEPNDVRMNVNLYNTCQVDLNEVWSDLIKEGVLTEQQRDTFNIPIYMRSIDDIREAIASCGSLFEVLTAEVKFVETTPMDAFETTDPIVLTTKWTGSWKAVLNPILEAHLGKEPVEVIWERYAKVLEKRIRTEGLSEMGSFAICSLIRK